MRRLFDCLCCLSGGASIGLGATGQFPDSTVEGLALLAVWCLVHAIEGGLDALNLYHYRQLTGRDP